MFIEMGRTLMLIGGLLFVVGLVLSVAGRIPGLGQLPGDIAIERENFRLYAPLGTMIVLSLVLTLILNLVGRFWR
jgi:hypothetical protein